MTITLDKPATVSAYFSPNSPQEKLNKRLHSLDSTEVDEPGPSKRTRILEQSESLSNSASSLTSQYFSARSPDEVEKRKRRLEAKKKSLLADNNPFLRRGGSVQFNKEPPPVVTEDGDDESESESDADLSSLIGFFTSEQRKSKKTASKRKQKLRDNELYTAGELQVRSLVLETAFCL
jgi:hypothetical protein